MKRLLLLVALLPVASPFILDSRAGELANLSTRAGVMTSDNLDDIMIGGFIIQGPPGSTKTVLVRGLGPALAAAGVSGSLADPVLALYNEAGSSEAANDNWKDSQKSEIEMTMIPPPNDPEAAVVVTLSPGNYTALVYGVADTDGVALVEVYDLDSSPTARLGNISTRGRVRTGDEVMIGGFILVGSDSTETLIRALGPSLGLSGVNGALGCPLGPTRRLSPGRRAALASDWSRFTTWASLAARVVSRAY